jgi:transglutaminase-like putative cysteine protease
MAGTPVAAVDRYFDLSVLGLVTSGYLAVLGSGYLDVPTAAVAAAGLLMRALMITGVLRLGISNRLTVALTIAYIGFYPLDYLFVSRDFVAATVHLVFFLAVMKVLTAHATRDYVFLGIIGFLELLAASILSSNLTFFVFLTLFLVFGVATFASAEVRRSMRKPHSVARTAWRRFQWRLAALTVSMSLGILALTGGLFFLLPRTAQAAFRHLVPQRFHLPGFSNVMTLGEIGEIQKRQTAVMHVKISNGPRTPRKWRGVALTQFDGRRWYNPPEHPEILKVTDGMVELVDQRKRWRTAAAQSIDYEVQLNAMSSDALFLAGTPELIRINARMLMRSSSNSFRVGFPNTEGLWYLAYSNLEETVSAGGLPASPLSPELRAANQQLPDLDGRIPTLARSISAGADSDAGRARAIEQHLQTSYRYTTRLLDREVADPLANFLFERRAGHCEYFASAMAVMLRVLGIPSRVATGFESGIYNPVSGWYVIRASDAHSWVEAYLPGRGWTTFDPTPPAQDRPSTSLWARIGFYMDAAETFWQQWVLNYNLDQQLTLASEMESSSRSFGAQWLERVRAAEKRWRAALVSYGRRYGAAFVFAVLLLGAGYWAAPKAWAWWRTLARVRQVKRGQASASDATLLYNRMLRFMKRCGFEKPSWITPAEFAGMLPASETAALVGSFTAAYNDLRFGGNAEAAAHMVGILERIERAPRR